MSFEQDVARQARINQAHNNQMLFRERMEFERAMTVTPPECECFIDCRSDSYSGRLHQHSEYPCSVHPEKDMA